MDEEIMSFLMIFDRFRKTNIFRIVPGISHNDYAIIKVIGIYGRKSPVPGKTKVSVLVQALGCPASAVSRSLRSLEERGLIMRMIDTKDRRNTIVSLTPKGLELEERTDRILKEFAEAVFGKLGKEKVQEFNEMLVEILHVINDELDKKVLTLQNTAKADG